MSRTNKVFMAIAKGTQIKEASIKRYVGYSNCSVLAVNPTKEELSELYGTTIENDPIYLQDKEIEKNGIKKTVKTARIDFIIKTPVEGEETELISKISFNLRKESRANTDGTKVQVIDKYARTAWVTKEQFAVKQIPMYSNGPAALDTDYRPCYFGEENLTTFIKVLLNIPNVDKFEKVNGNWKRTGIIDNPETAEVRFDSLDKVFEGDFSEIREAVSYQPTNTIKLLFGVRRTDDNKLYQSVFTDMFLSPNAKESGINRLKTEVTNRQSAGAYPNTTFDVAPLHEYKETPTSFSAFAEPSVVPESFNPFSQSTDDVFNNASTNDLPFGF